MALNVRVTQPFPTSWRNSDSTKIVCNGSKDDLIVLVHFNIVIVNNLFHLLHRQRDSISIGNHIKSESQLNLLKQQNCKHFSSSSWPQRKWEILSHSMDSHFTHFSNRFRKRSWTIIFASFCVSRTDAESSTPRHTSLKLLSRLFSK